MLRLNHKSTCISEEDNPNDVEEVEHQEQPECMELVKPMATFEDIQTDIPFDDGGPDYDWFKTSFEYPEGLGVSWLENLSDSLNDKADTLDIPDVE